MTSLKQTFAIRLRNARKMKGLTYQQLGDAIGISKQMISKYEKGKSIPDSSNLIKLSKALNVKPDYFFRQPAVQLGNVEFRKKARMPKSKVERIKQLVLHKMENYLYIEHILSINTNFRNPLKGFEGNVEEAAVKVRKVWKIGNDPIGNVINLLETHEIKVIEIDAGENEFDGLATFVDGKYPVIVINKNFPIERKRFTLMHELGHLLMKFPENMEHKALEKKCHRFGGAMLFPKDLVIENFGAKRHHITLRELIIIQEEFGISITALVYRLHTAGIISKEHVRSFFISMNTNPALKEKIELSRYQGKEESERFVQLVFRALAEEVITISKASALLETSVEDIRKQYQLV